MHWVGCKSPQKSFRFHLNENKENIIKSPQRCFSAPGSVKRALTFEDATISVQKSSTSSTDSLFSPSFKKNSLRRSYTTIGCVSNKTENLQMSSKFQVTTLSFDDSESSLAEIDLPVFSLRTDEQLDDDIDDSDESTDSIGIHMLDNSEFDFLKSDDTLDLSSSEEDVANEGDYDHDLEA